MRYVITDGSRWIMQNYANEYVIVNNFTMADSFPRERAEFILHKKLNKRNRKLFRLEKFVENINDTNRSIKVLRFAIPIMQRNGWKKQIFLL